MGNNAALSYSEKSRGKVVKPTQADTNDKCRFCPFQFSVIYGNFGNLMIPSSENLYKISSKKEYNDTKTLAELCEELGFSVPRCSRFSERICKACGRNLRRTPNFYNQIKRALEKEGVKENKDVAAQVAGYLQAKELRHKRGLPTTISLERRSPQRKKVERAGVPARKSLDFRETSQSVLDRTLSDLSINELIGQPSTQIKVLVLNANQRDESVSNSEHFQEEVENCGQHCV